MNERKNRIINCFEQPEEHKQITNLLKAGNFKKVSGKGNHTINVKRNRIIMVALALILFMSGFFYVVF